MEAVTFAKALHHRMDLNGDGFVTPQEEASFIVSRMNGLPIPGTDVAHPLPPLSAAIFAAADIDHDGRLSEAESAAEAAHEFALADSNNDGLVMPAERMALTERMIAAGKLPDGVSIGAARTGH